MAEPFDLIVVGTGAGGSEAAYRCKSKGWRVAVVDELPYGGTCALRGCDPKKVLVSAAELVDWNRRMQGRAVRGETRIAWPELMAFKRTFTDPVPADSEAGFQKAGIMTYHGPAHFVQPDKLSVGGEVLEGRHFVVATGAKPRRLGIPGEEHLATSTDFLELERLPDRIAFVGGGYISFEFAHVARSAGAHATILGRRVALRQFEQDLVQRLVDHTSSLGVEVRLGSEVTGVEKNGDGYRLHVRADGREDTVEADLVVHGAGRVPNTEDLRLQDVNVATEESGGVQVNEYLQNVTNPHVYAAGDVVGLPGTRPLTPVAAYEGAIVASNLLGGNHRTPDYRGIPSVAFTAPPLATVGLTEAEAREQDLDVRVRTEDTSSWYSNRRVGEVCAMFKSVVERDSDRVVGMHLLGPDAAEVINLFALAIRQGVTARDLKQQLYAFPTSGSDVPYML